MADLLYLSSRATNLVPCRGQWGVARQQCVRSRSLYGTGCPAGLCAAYKPCFRRSRRAPRKPETAIRPPSVTMVAILRFLSSATNLSSGSTSSRARGVFVRDTCGGPTAALLCSRDFSGSRRLRRSLAVAVGGAPAMSSDGRYVAFYGRSSGRHRRRAWSQILLADMCFGCEHPGFVRTVRRANFTRAATLRRRSCESDSFDERRWPIYCV